MKKARLNLAMPMAALMLAVGGAFAFDSANMETDAFAPETGYLDSPLPCTQEVQCDTQFNVVCTDNGIQAYGKDADTGECIRTLYMPPQ